MAREDIVVENDGAETICPDDKTSAWLERLFENAHLNMLLGAGFSREQLPELGFREEWKLQADEMMSETGEKKSHADIVDAALFAEYFSSIISPMRNLSVNNSQLQFLRCLEQIVENRGNVIVPRRVNIFTTNYDPLIEMALEQLGIEYNDGFSGRMSPVFDTASFSKIQTIQSLLLEYSQQVPTINVIKMHGSVTWERVNEQIVFSDFDKNIESLGHSFKNVLKMKTCKLIKESVNKPFSPDGFDAINACLDGELRASSILMKDLEKFEHQYRAAFQIVNPNKEKFRETVFNLTYYELMRLFANELDRSDSLLLVFGFSFRDEHIREITKRALKNRNLQILVSCHRNSDAESIHRAFPGEDKVRCIVPKADEKLELDQLASLLTRMAK